MKNIAIVTGASSGLGKEFVRLIAKKRGIDEIWAIAVMNRSCSVWQ